MPKDKDLKRIVRTRMQKTGESYTAARARILAKKTDQTGRTGTPGPAGEPATPETASSAEASPEAAPPEDYATLAGTADDTVRARTGRGWAEWVALLDAAGAAAWPHRDIAAWIEAEHGTGGWWAQSVTVGYERIRGLRAIGQRRDGAWEANKSKTLPVPAAVVWRALADETERERWLPGVELTVRTAIPEKSMRVTWPDGTSVQLYLTAKGDARTQLAVQHAKLVSKEDVEERKAFWGERLGRLAELLAAGGG